MKFSIELDGFGGGQITAESAVVDVTANCGEWRDGPQSVENLVIANVTGMQDVVAAGECLDGFRTQQSVSIGDDADAHANSLRQHRQRPACVDRAGLAGCRR